MSGEELRSIAVGTGGLSLAAAIALWLTLTRSAADPVPQSRNRLLRVALPAVVLQIAHFTEELSRGFYVRFPELIGLRPWPAGFFVSFNLVWIALWILSLVGLRSHPRAALFPLWFLGIASALNGIAHPLLSILARSDFPGLWTSPFVGVAGVLLLRRLVLFTEPARASA